MHSLPARALRTAGAAAAAPSSRSSATASSSARIGDEPWEAEQRAINRQAHRLECEAALAAWPTITLARRHGETMVGTTAYATHGDAMSHGDAPYFTNELIKLTDEPLLSADVCSAIIEETEARGVALGWGSRYTLQVRSI